MHLFVFGLEVIAENIENVIVRGGRSFLKKEGRTPRKFACEREGWMIAWTAART